MPKHFVNNSKTSFWGPENDFFDPKIAKNDPSNRSKVVKFWLKISIFEVYYYRPFELKINT